MYSRFLLMIENRSMYQELAFIWVQFSLVYSKIDRRVETKIRKYYMNFWLRFLYENSQSVFFFYTLLCL